MNKLRAFLAMLKKAGVVFKQIKKGKLCTIIVKACKGPANEGYEGLYTAFVFYAGQLQSVGAWET